MTDGKIMPRKKVKIPKNKKKTRNYVASNAKAVNKLTSDVYKLKMSQYGSLQRNFQVQSTISKPLIPTAARPCLFDASDFTCRRDPNADNLGAELYQNNLVGILTSAPLWDVSPLGSNIYWTNVNEDRVDTGKYFMDYAKYSLKIEGAPTLDNTTVLIQAFTQKAKPLGSLLPGQPSLRLPDALGQLNDMASPSLNRLNKQYFKLHWQKKFFINSSKAAVTKGTSHNIFRWSFTLRPKKVRHQLITSPNLPPAPPDPLPDQAIIDAVNDHLDEDSHSSDHVDLPAADPPADEAGDFSPFNSAVDEPYWILISTDDINATTPSDAVHIEMSRICQWRDAYGDAAI